MFQKILSWATETMVMNTTEALKQRTDLQIHRRCQVFRFKTIYKLSTAPAISTMPQGVILHNPVLASAAIDCLNRIVLEDSDSVRLFFVR